MNTICVIGLGYIGLPTSTLLASRGKKIIGVDVNEQVVDTINQGRIHIVEPELDVLLKQVVSDGLLRAVTRPEPADAFIIAVPTPLRENHKPDLSFVKAAALSVAPVLAKGNLIILESTSPVGTTEDMAQWLAAARPDLTFPQQAGEEADVQIAYCPERVLPGKMLEELVTNARIVGGMSSRASEMATELYRTVVKGEIRVTDPRTAELCKLTENSFRDVNIAFANELSMICDKLGVDVWQLIKLANLHPRVNILQPGCGVGGHCIPIDPWFIVDSVPEEASLIKMAREVNILKTQRIVEKIRIAIEEFKTTQQAKFRKITIACFGIGYKKKSDDIRNSSSISIIQEIAKYDIDILVVDDQFKSLPKEIQFQNVFLKKFTYIQKNADIFCFLTHAESIYLKKIFFDDKKIIMCCNFI